MARRGYIGGGRPRLQFDPSVFMRGGGGDENDLTKMAMAMMGYGKGTSPQDQALDAQKQAWAEKYQAGQLSLQELQQKAAEANYKSEAEARTAGITDTAEQRRVAAQAEVQRQKELADSLERARGIEARATAKGLLDTMVKEGRITVGDANYNRLAEKSMPGYAEESKQLAQADREKSITEGLTKYQKADPKAKAAYTKAPASLGVPPDIADEILKRAGVQVAQPGAPAAASRPYEGAISKPWQEYQAPDLSELLTPAPPPSGTEGIAPWLRPEAPSSGAMDWRYGGGGPSVDPGRYEKFPGSVEDLIAASGQQPVAEPAPVPVQAPALEGTGFLDELLRKIRGGGPPMPSQGVFQPFPG